MYLQITLTAVLLSTAVRVIKYIKQNITHTVPADLFKTFSNQKKKFNTNFSIQKNRKRNL